MKKLITSIKCHCGGPIVLEINSRSQLFVPNTPIGGMVSRSYGHRLYCQKCGCMYIPITSEEEFITKNPECLFVVNNNLKVKKVTGKGFKQLIKLEIVMKNPNQLGDYVDFIEIFCFDKNLKIVGPFLFPIETTQ